MRMLHSAEIARRVLGAWTLSLMAFAMAGCTAEPSAGVGSVTGASVEANSSNTRIGQDTAGPTQAGRCGEIHQGPAADLASWKELLAGTGQDAVDVALGRSVGVWRLSTDGCGDADRAIVLRDCPGDDGWIVSSPRLLSARTLASHGVIEVSSSRTVVADGPSPGTISAVFFGAQSPSARAFVSSWLATCLPGSESDHPRAAALDTGILAVRVTTASGLDPVQSERLLKQLRDRIARAAR